MKKLVMLPIKLSNEPGLENAVLQAFTSKGLLVIAVGIETLAYCAEWENGGPPITEGVKITDAQKFVDCLAKELERDNEVGATFITKMFDAAIEETLGNGPEGVTFPKKWPVH